MALQHLGLMHSLLALSSRHLDTHLAQHQLPLPVTRQSLRKRSSFHGEEALQHLHLGIADETADQVAIAATLAQMLCLLLQTLVDAHPSGEHRLHLQAYQSLMHHRSPSPGPLLDFVREIFHYHLALDELMRLPSQQMAAPMAAMDWRPMVPLPAVTYLIGVADGAFHYMSQITTIRNTIRANRHRGMDPVVDYRSLHHAAIIDAGIRDWAPYTTSTDSRALAGLLYKQMMWVYLWHTIYPLRSANWAPDKRIIQAVDDGIAMLQSVAATDAIQTVLLAPAFILGCAAVEARQRIAIRQAIETVGVYKGTRSGVHALCLLDEVWRLLDARDEASWDFQFLAQQAGLDLLVA